MQVEGVEVLVVVKALLIQQELELHFKEMVALVVMEFKQVVMLWEELVMVEVLLVVK